VKVFHICQTWPGGLPALSDLGGDAMGDQARRRLRGLIGRLNRYRVDPSP
jgi:hypothetical protein